MANIIDVAKETERLTKETDKLTKEQAGLQARLNNADFVAKAPAAVVEGQKKRLDEIKTALEKNAAALERLKSL